MAERPPSQDPVKLTQDQLQSTQDQLQTTQDLLQCTQDQPRSTQDQPRSTQEHIHVKVSGQDGSLVHFKVKMNTKMEKVMKAYCQRQGFNIENLRFFFDGQPLNGSDTPATLGMEDKDVIDAFQRQTGGEGK